MKRPTNQRLHELYIYVCVCVYRYTCRWRLVEPITQFVRAVPFRGALLETFLFFFFLPPFPSKSHQCRENERRGLLSGEPGKNKGEGKVVPLLVEISNNFSSPFAGHVGWTRVSRPFSLLSGRSPTSPTSMAVLAE